MPVNKGLNMRTGIQGFWKAHTSLDSPTPPRLRGVPRACVTARVLFRARLARKDILLDDNARGRERRIIIPAS